MQNLVAEGALSENLFSFYLDQSGDGSTLEIGGTDPLYTDAINYTPVTSQNYVSPHLALWYGPYILIFTSTTVASSERVHRRARRQRFDFFCRHCRFRHHPPLRPHCCSCPDCEFILDPGSRRKLGTRLI